MTDIPDDWSLSDEQILAARMVSGATCSNMIAEEVHRAIADAATAHCWQLAQAEIADITTANRILTKLIDSQEAKHAQLVAALEAIAALKDDVSGGCHEEGPLCFPIAIAALQLAEGE